MALPQYRQDRVYFFYVEAYLCFSVSESVLTNGK